MTAPTEIRAAVLRWLVRNGNPVRSAGLDVYERMGMQMHLSGERRMLEGLESRRGARGGGKRAYGIFMRWLEEVPETGCELMFERCSWEDASWSTWNSFDETGWTEYGVDVEVWCRCGKIAGAVWRYEGSWGDLLRGITEEA